MPRSSTQRYRCLTTALPTRNIRSPSRFFGMPANVGANLLRLSYPVSSFPPVTLCLLKLLLLVRPRRLPPNCPRARQPKVPWLRLSCRPRVQKLLRRQMYQIHLLLPPAQANWLPSAVSFWEVPTLSWVVQVAPMLLMERQTSARSTEVISHRTMRLVLSRRPASVPSSRR